MPTVSFRGSASGKLSLVHQQRSEKRGDGGMGGGGLYFILDSDFDNHAVKYTF